MRRSDDRDVNCDVTLSIGRDLSTFTAIDRRDVHAANSLDLQRQS